MYISDDSFIFAGWIFIPMIAGILLTSHRTKTMIPYIIISVLLFGAGVVGAVLSQTLSGEDSIGAAFMSFFTFNAFAGLQLGTGGLWVVRRVKAKRKPE